MVDVTCRGRSYPLLRYLSVGTVRFNVMNIFVLHPKLPLWTSLKEKCDGDKTTGDLEKAFTTYVPGEVNVNFKLCSRSVSLAA